MPHVAMQDLTPFKWGRYPPSTGSMARDLFSKLLAAGLSAGVFLIWWPEHHPTTGLVSLVVRGALWTLAYELLLVAFVPLERLVRRALKERIRERRLPPLNAPARIGGACVLACAGAALPVFLLAGSDAPRLTPPPAKRVVVVKRSVVRRQRVVVRREVVTVPTPERFVTVATPTPTTKPAPVPKPKTTKAPPATTTVAQPAPAATTEAVPPAQTQPQ